MNVAFAGLGVMGYPMAGYLAKAGHEVTVYNRTVEKAEKWCMEKGVRSRVRLPRLPTTQRSYSPVSVTTTMYAK